MSLISRFSRSNELVAGMADRVGDDLSASCDTQPVSAASRRRGMVIRCATCTAQDDCQHLQDANAVLDAPPAYCRNRDQFHR
jgi:hypothetical protein